MSTARKIFFVIPNSEIGGAQNFFKRLFNNIDVGNKYFYVEDLISFGKLNFFHRVFSLYKLTKSSKGQIVIYATVNSVVSSIFCKIFFRNFFLISRLGNTLSSEIKDNLFIFLKNIFIYKAIAKFSDYFVFQSQAMKEDAISLLRLKDQKKFVVIHNGIDFKEIEKLSMMKSKLNIDSRYCNFLLNGSFKHQKGYDIFFEAIKLMSIDDLSSMRFHICGGGELFKKFEEQAKQLSLSKYINLLGWVENPYPIMKKMDSYILPSRYEGFPNSLIEALSYGLPSIVSRSPGANLEIVTNQFNGMTFKNEDANDLSRKILQMRDTLQSFDSDAIVQDVKTRFNIMNIANEYKQLLC